MSIDLVKLRESEDRGVNAVRSLPESSKWAALETLIAELGLRPLTQVDVAAEKIKAFKKETT